MFKKVIFNTSAQIIGKVITASTTLLITLLIVRSLGPAGYGDFTKIFVFIGYFYSFADFGLNNIYIKLSNSQKNNNLIRYLVGLRLIISIILAFAAITISLFLPYDPTVGIGYSPAVKIAIAVGSLTIVTQALFTAANAFFQNKLRYDLSAVAAAIGTLVILSFVTLSTVLEAPLIYYVAAYVLGGMTFVTVSYLIIFLKFRQKILPLFKIREFTNLAKQAFPVAVALIFNIIYFRVDVLILAYSRPTEEVGLYGLAYTFFEASLTVPIFFSNALYPLLARLHKENPLAYASQTKKWFMFLCAVSALHILGLRIVSYLIPLIDSRFSFDASQTALLILSAGIPFFYISALLWHLLIIGDKQRFLSAIYIIGAIVNVAFNLIFIPKYGYLAASTITVVSEVLIALLLFLALKVKRYDKI